MTTGPTGNNGVVGMALARLRQAADETRAGWLPSIWHQDGKAAAEDLRMEARVVQGQPYGILPDLVLEPGEELSLHTELDLPGSLHGVPLVGEPLELTLNSLYPIGVHIDGRPVFDDDGCPAAAGPALITVLPSLRAGRNGPLQLRIRPGRNSVPQIDVASVPPWVWLHFTSPGLRHRFEVLDVAWARLYLADALAETDEARAVVDLAATLVPKDLSSASEAALAATARALVPLAPLVAEHTVHLIGHSHIDLAWLWRWNETVDVVQRDVESVLSLMDEFEEMCFTHSQAPTYEVLREHRPELFARVREHIDAGRWEPATMQWVESDTNVVAGESLSRQLLEGVTYSRRHLGGSPEVFFAPDTFGHAGNLPQLAASAGARAYYHHRCVPGDPDPWPAYWWEGEDGSRLLGLSTPAYYGHITAGEVARAAVRAAGAGQSVAMHFYGVCDHGGGPTRQSLQTLRRIASDPLLPRMACSTVGRFVEDLLSEDPALPVHRGESSLTFRGCYSSRVDAKQMNRRGEALLTTAETLTVLAGGCATDVPPEAWRTQLFHQFHDILGGCAIPEVYEDQAAAAAGVEAIASHALAKALEVLRAGLDAGTLAVSNPHAWHRTDVVFVEGVDVPWEAGVLTGSHGHVTSGQRTTDGLCFIASVPGFSTVTYVIGKPLQEPAQPAAPVLVDGGRRARIPTSDGSIDVDLTSGSLQRWSTSAGDVLPAAARLNVLQLVEEAPVAMSAWTVGECALVQDLLEGGTTDILECGPVRTVLRTTRTVRSSSVEQRLTIYPHQARIDVEIRLDWKERGGPREGVPGLKAAFHTAMGEATAWYETPFAATCRREDAGEVPALGWAALQDTAGHGVAVLADACHGYDSSKGTLRLRLIRSPYEPDPTADLRRHILRYAILPLTAGWQAQSLARQAAGFLVPLPAGEVTGNEKSQTVPWPVRVSAEGNVVVVGLKPARHQEGVVVRLYESTGSSGAAQIHGLPRGAEVLRTSIVEDPLHQEQVGGDGAVALRLGPFEVCTLIVMGTEAGHSRA